MKTSHRMFVCILFVASGIGCSSTPAYKNYKGPDAACIAGHTQSFLEFSTNKASSTIITMVDGVSTQGANIMTTGSICFPPGQHLIQIGIPTDRFHSSPSDSFLIDFAPGSRYKARGKLHGRASAIRLYEIRNGQEVEVGSKPVQSARLPFF
jgi:hypothetical protein